ncbi:hypothetical protein D3C76_979100 [compost metagenome]
MQSGYLPWFTHLDSGRQRIESLYPPPLSQHHIQLIHHLRPIGIIQDFIAQQIRLARAPEKSIRQVQVRFER